MTSHKVEPSVRLTYCKHSLEFLILFSSLLKLKIVRFFTFPFLSDTLHQLPTANEAFDESYKSPNDRLHRAQIKKVKAVNHRQIIQSVPKFYVLEDAPGVSLTYRKT